MRALLAGLLLFFCVSAHAEEVTVTHWGSAFYGAPYAVAMAKGFFKQQGVDITGILSGIGGGTSVRNTLAGGLPFGEVALAATVEAIRHGEPIVIVCGGTDSVGDIGWIAKKGSPLHSIKDLAGKRVGYTAPGSVTNMLILMSLKASGMKASDVHLVPAGDIGANLSAVLNGAIDTGMTGEPVWSENEDKLQIVFWPKDILGPNMTQNVCITTKEYAESPEGARKISAILAARREGVKYLYAHPDEAADITAEAFHGDKTLYRRVFKHMIALHYWSEGEFDFTGMDRMVEGLRILNQISGPVDWKTMIDARFLPEDLRPKQ